MGVFLKVCCIYSEHFLIGAPPRAASAEQIQTGIKLWCIERCKNLPPDKIKTTLDINQHSYSTLIQNKKRNYYNALHFLSMWFCKILKNHGNEFHSWFDDVAKTTGVVFIS